MSRVAKKPICIPKGISVEVNDSTIIFTKGNLKIKKKIHNCVKPILLDNKIFFNVVDKTNYYWMHAGTCRSIVNNIIIGIMYGFIKKLLIIGVGYKVYIENNILFLNLGFSYVIKYNIPLNIELTCPNLNEIIVKGWDKELVGIVAAKIRSFHPPEKYKKGKGIRYFNEIVRIKEHKKKLSK